MKHAKDHNRLKIKNIYKRQWDHFLHHITCIFLDGMKFQEIIRE